MPHKRTSLWNALHAVWNAMAHNNREQVKVDRQLLVVNHLLEVLKHRNNKLGPTGPSQSGPAPSTSTTTPSSQPNVGTASEFATNLNAGGTTATAHPAVTSAFEALGKTQPAVTQEDVTPDEAMKNLVLALGR